MKGALAGRSNNFIVDGLSANDDAAALSGIPYGVDSVDQFQVVTSGVPVQPVIDVRAADGGRRAAIRSIRGSTEILTAARKGLESAG